MNFSVETFSQGKKSKGHPKEKANEDRYLVTPHYIAVIDGATANPPILIKGLTSGEYASDTITKILKKAPPNLHGNPLINYISEKFQDNLAHLPRIYKSQLEKTPFSKPTASLAIATLGINEIIMTQLGDVGYRVNGTTLYDNPKEIDTIHAQQRVAAIEKVQSEHPEYSHEQLLQIGKNAIESSLRRQVIDLQNNPNHPLGYGVIDGSRVHPKFIITRRIPQKSLHSLELFSDGYFKVADQPAIASWEKAFQEVEKQDPDKTGKYPSVKGSTKDMYTDDRTVVIARFKDI